MTIGTATVRATVSWFAKLTVDRIRAHGGGPVLQGAGRQPRRDRNPGLPHPPRARDRHGGGLLRGRPRLAPRPGCGRGVPRRTGYARRELPARRADPRRGPARGG